VTPSVAAPSDTNPSDATGCFILREKVEGNTDGFYSTSLCIELHRIGIKPTEALEGVRVKLISGFTAAKRSRVVDRALAATGVFDTLICTTNTEQIAFYRL